MQKLAELKQRIRTVEGIEAVTRTMATVSSAKLSRTRQRAAGMRVYVRRLRDMLDRQQIWAAGCGLDLVSLSPLLQPRGETRSVLLVHLAGDRGMCGNYNMAINALAREWIARRQSEGLDVSVVVKGRLGERNLCRRARVNITRAEGWPRAGVVAAEVDRLCSEVIEAFQSGSADEVHCSYTRFFSPVRREPAIVRLLPLTPETAPPLRLREMARARRWWHEPSFADVIAALVPLLVRAQVEDVLLESYASEHAARMINMEEASERAGRRLQEMRITYNRLRREAITSDLLGVLFASQLRAEESPEAETAATDGGGGPS